MELKSKTRTHVTISRSLSAVLWSYTKGESPVWHRMSHQYDSFAGSPKVVISSSHAHPCWKVHELFFCKINFLPWKQNGRVYPMQISYNAITTKCRLIQIVQLHHLFAICSLEWRQFSEISCMSKFESTLNDCNPLLWSFFTNFCTFKAVDLRFHWEREKNLTYALYPCIYIYISYYKKVEWT